VDQTADVYVRTGTLDNSVNKRYLDFNTVCDVSFCLLIFFHKII